MMEYNKFKKLIEGISTILKGKEIPSQVIESKSLGEFRVILQ